MFDFIKTKPRASIDCGPIFRNLLKLKLVLLLKDCDFFYSSLKQSPLLQLFVQIFIFETLFYSTICVKYNVSKKLSENVLKETIFWIMQDLLDRLKKSILMIINKVGNRYQNNMIPLLSKVIETASTVTQRCMLQYVKLY